MLRRGAWLAGEIVVSDRMVANVLDTDPAAFAGRLLEELGLPARPIEAADGWANHVWLAPAHVVRLSSGRFRDSFAHERAVLDLLPPEVPHARIHGYGRAGRREWLVLDRMPGRPLMRVWSSMSESQRRTTTGQLGNILHALHAIRIPEEFSNPWLDDALAPGGSTRDAYHAPPDQFRRLLVAAYETPGVDRSLLDEVDAFVAERSPAFSGDRLALVHGDVHFDNLLWEDGRLTALLDFEGARPAAPDQELDTLLRFACEPELYRGRGGQMGPTRRELASFGDWLASAYPDLFAHPLLAARLEVYDALWHLVQLLNFPPGSRPPDPLGHLRTLLDAGLPSVSR
jgi:aminoglycoside phosphotransferase (APT) family kinase protein